MSNHDMECYMENVAINRDDLYINFEKFTSGKSNIILITGFSGSGKTTHARKIATEYKCDDYIELDSLSWWFAKAITEEKLREGVPACYDFLKSHPEYMNMDRVPTQKEEGKMYEEFIPYVISWCKKRSPKKYVIEGIQLYETYQKGDKFPYSGYPMILKGTSGLKSCYRAYKRNKSKVKDIPDYLKWMFIDNKQIEALYKAMKEEYDKEERLMESSNDPILSYLEKYGDSTLYEESGEKTRYNDKGEKVPDICTKCGGKIGIFIQGEPVYLCVDCKKYYGTVPFSNHKKKKKDKNINESGNSDYSYSYLKDSDIPEFYDSFEKTFHTRDCGLNKSEIKEGIQAIKFDNKVIGYIGFSYYNEKGKKYMGIGNFMIKPEYQGKGHGTNVIADIIEKNKDKYDEIYCYVDKKNTKAISFYKKIGDVRTNEETKYGYYVTLYRKDKPFEESSRSELPNYKFGIEDKRKFELDTKKHVESAIKLFGHAEESDKKHLAKRIAEEAEKYGIEIPETTQVYKYLHEDYNEDYSDELFLEAALRDTTILKDRIYPNIEDRLSNPTNVRKLKKITSDFIEKNTDKLTTPGPQYLIVFGDQDKELYYELLGITKEEVLSAMKDVVKETGSKSDFKYLLGNPFLALLYYIIRYFTYHKDVKALNACLGMFAIDVYWSIFTKYFPNGIIEPVMNYTIDNLTDKFILKKAGTIFGALTESARRSYGFHEQKIKDGRDADCVSFMQRIRNDQNSMFRTLSTIYYKNHKEGNAIATRNDDYDPNNPILDDIHTSSTEVQSIVDRTCMPMVTNGIDIALAEAAARMSNISIVNLRIYLTKIFVNERLEEITTLVESMIFLFINESKRSIRDIKSQYFLYWSCALFKKTNSKDGNVIRINAILDKWGKDTGIYEAFRSDGSRINYKKAIFLYIAMSVQKYT